MSEEESLEETKVKVLIKLRGYKLVKKERKKDAINYIVRIPREKQKAIIHCIPGESTVGIAFVKGLDKAMQEAKVKMGIIVTGGRYTHAAKMNAKKTNIELLPRTFPAFDIFKHELVPKHEILTPEEREELHHQYRVQPYKLPQIKASDPTVTAIGAKPGDVLRIIRRSSTAGKHIAYRYVVE